MKNIKKNISSYKIDDKKRYNNICEFESGESSSISVNYSIEELIKDNKLDLNEIDHSHLESIRLSLTFGNKEINPQILLDRMTGMKSSIRKSINQKNNNINKNYIESILNEKDYKMNAMNVINTNKGLDIDNNKNIYIKAEDYYSEDDNSLNIKEYEYNNIDTDNSDSLKKNHFCFEKMRENENYKENQKILKKQNELFIQLLNDNENENNNHNIRKKQIIISNLNEDLNNLTEIDESKEKKKLNNYRKKAKYKKKESKIILGKNSSFKNIKNKKIHIPFNNHLTKNKSNKLSSYEKYNKNNKSLTNRNVINDTKNIILNNKKYNSNRNQRYYNNKKFMDIKYYTKVNSNKDNSKKGISLKNNYNSKKNSVNEHHNLMKLIPILKRNESAKSIFEPNLFYNSNKIKIQQNIYSSRKKEKDYNKFIFKNGKINNNKYKNISIPKDKKKISLNQNYKNKNYVGNNIPKITEESKNKKLNINNKKINNNVIKALKVLNKFLLKNHSFNVNVNKSLRKK